MNLNSAVISILVFWQVTSSYAQDVLTQQEVLNLVKEFHPVARQAKLLKNEAESTILMAKGGFDPYISSSIDQKYYQEKKYYSLINGGLTIPTWYGIKIKTGIEQNQGVFLNPEDNVPTEGLWTGGVTFSIGKGLVIDKRRAALKKAEIFADATIVERQIIMNQLLLETLEAYWAWVESWRKFQIYSEARDLAEDQFEAVKRSYVLGDRPAIDTLELQT